MKTLTVVFFILISSNLFCQQPLPETGAEDLQQHIAFAAEQSGQTDEAFTELEAYAGATVNLNEAGEDDLAGLPLSKWQMESLISYRAMLGPLVDIHELQAVPGWDEETIRRLKPFVKVAVAFDPAATFKKRWREGEHSLLLRTSVAKQFSSGSSDDSVPTPASPERLLVRYRFHAGNSMQYGLLAEKDPGETMFRQGRQKGFDFYSFHFFMKTPGSIRSIALGDYRICLGQGLISWQGFGFAKGSDVIMIKRQSPVLQPHRSAGEINFMRGAACSWQIRGMDITVFFSHRKMDASAERDSVKGNVLFVSSLINTGLHRTESEYRQKAVLPQTRAGISLRKEWAGWNLGIQGILNRQAVPLMPSPGAHNLYDAIARHSANISLDFSRSWRNIHVFGEWAVNERKAPALIQGVMACLGTRADLSLLYRHISPKYHSFQSASFTEKSDPNNEQGLYLGLSVRPNRRWEAKFFADFFSFPWLRYRMSSPSYGREFLIQVINQPQKKLAFVWTFRNKQQIAAGPSSGGTLLPVLFENRKQFQFSMKNEQIRNVSLHLRFNWMGYSDGFGNKSEGRVVTLYYKYHSPSLHLSTGMGLHFFQADNYQSRVYIIENESLAGSSTIGLEGRGGLAEVHVSFKFKSCEFSFSMNRYLPGVSDSPAEPGDLMRISGKGSIAGQFRVVF